MAKYPAAADLRLEVAETPTGLQNLIYNDSGEFGGWGWTTPVANTLMSADYPDIGLTFTTVISQAAYFTTDNLPAKAGDWYAAHFGIYTPGAIKYRFEWYDLAGTLLSSSTQSALIGPGLLVAQYGPVQAPASTAYVRLRIDLYHASGSTPPAGMYVNFQHATVAGAATSGELATIRTNLIPNPSIETNTTGWTTFGGSIARSTAQAWVGLASLAGTTNSQGRLEVVSNSPYYAAVVAGLSYTFSVYVRGVVAGEWALQLNWRDAGGFSVGSPDLITNLNDTVGAWTRFEITGVAPVGATQVDVRVSRTQKSAEANTLVAYVDGFMVERAPSAGVYFDGASTDLTGVVYDWTGTANLSTSTETRSNLPFIPPVSWLNIIGPTYRIGIERAELDVSALTASIKDGVLDPAKSDLLRPGKPVRVTAYDGTNWQTLYTGKLLVANSKYDPFAGTTEITLSAVDAASTLAQVTAPAGVATIDELPYVLEGAAVPWNVNGSGNQVPSATVVSRNESAKVIDQVAITRDTVHGYAWVCRLGILQAWDADEITTTPVGALDESDYTADLDVSFDVDRCINEVTIKLLRFNLATGETVEVPYGPYRDEDSVDEWGPYAKEFTVQGLTDDESTMAAFAANVFAANAQPQVRINAITLPIRSTADVSESKALLDLYDLLQVSNTNADLDQTARVVKLSHEITPGKWLVSVGFSPEGGVAPPQATPAVANDPGTKFVTGSQGTFSTGTFTGANVNKTLSITFPDPFEVAPVVTLTPIAANALNINYAPCVVSVTTTGFIAAVARNVGTAAFDVAWIARTDDV